MRYLVGLLLSVAMLFSAPGVKIIPQMIERDLISDESIGANDTLYVATIDAQSATHLDVCIAATATEATPLSIILRAYEPGFSKASDTCLMYDEMRITLESGNNFICNNMFYLVPFNKYKLYLWNESGTNELIKVGVRIRRW